MSLVLDSSASLAWCFEDERSPPVIAILDRVIESHAIVPVLWRYEFANGLLNAQRRKRIEARRRIALMTEIDALDIREDQVPRGESWQRVSVLADSHGLTVYDATYLELALRIGLPLATLDDALRRAAGTVGIDVLP